MFDDLHYLLRENAERLADDDQSHLDSADFRTLKLARTIDQSINTESLRILTFRIGHEQFGWLVTGVRAIAHIEYLTPVPAAPACYRGVTSYRGQILSVLDLGVYMGGPPADPIPQMIIILGGHRLEIGVLADDVFDVVELPRVDLTGDGLEPGLIRGVTADGLSILDPDELLAREWQRVNDGQP